MRQTFRCGVAVLIFMAVAGLARASDLPKDSVQYKQHEEQARSLAEIGPTLKRPQEPDETTKPCNAGEENRKSDLCAQWKAADAASESARDSRLQVRIGIATLVAAVAAAISATVAAFYTERGATAATAAAKAAQEQLAIEHRARLQIYQFRLDVSTGEGNVVVLNKGAEDAAIVNSEIFAFIGQLPQGYAGRLPSQQNRHGENGLALIAEWKRPKGIVIESGVGRDWPFKTVRDYSPTASNIKKAMRVNGLSGIYILGRIVYRDGREQTHNLIFGRKLNPKTRMFEPFGNPDYEMDA